VLSDTDGSQLNLAARRHPEAARRAFLKIKYLREKLYSIFVAVARERRPSAVDLEAFNKALGSAMRFRSVAGGAAFTWMFGGSGKLLERTVWPILLGAAELLVSDQRSRIKVCRGDGCGFLIYDKSKNRSRRWCAMQPCGNRVKVRRYQSRHHR
jgi:predicted RNA-binding Zn ribbon-like protein